jgi:hypothetical protein
MVARSGAIWAGWLGTGLFFASWLAFWGLSSTSFAIWVGLLCAAVLLCSYGAVRGSRWFFISLAMGFLVTGGMAWLALRPER